MNSLGKWLVGKDSKVGQIWKSSSFLLALGLHILLISLLLFTFEKTIRIPDHISDPNKPIIDAVIVNFDAVKKEVKRLDQIEKAKVEKEKARLREVARKEKEAVERRKKEEALAIELKKKNEQLKKEAELQKIAKEKQIKEKKQHEVELKKIEKQKEEALAQKKKIEDDKKAAEEAVRQQANIKMKLDQLTQHAMLIKNKINRNWRQPLGFDFSGMTCEISVKLLPTGEVLDAIVIKSSGNVEFDRSTELAIRKASPLPMPTDQELVKEFRQFTFTFRPEVA